VSTNLACIDTFEHGNAALNSAIVVDANITDENEEQTITLSRSTYLNSDALIPVNDAKVRVVDRQNNTFEFVESANNDGKYKGRINSEFLVVGNAFKLSFVTHEGHEYQSDFEEMLPCPEVDSVYYAFFDAYYEEDNSEPKNGAHFYIDLKADNEFGNFYRWQVEETYEYRSAWPIITYWEGEWVTKAPDYSLFYCYKTEMVPSIFIATTSHLTNNEYLRKPLHFVSNESQRLYYRYSILVKQMSVSERAYVFWNGLKSNNQTAGGLFDSQPVDVESNVSCLSNSNQIVLGYFGVSSVKSKRQNFADFPGLVYNAGLCNAYKVDKSVIEAYTFSFWPVYIAPAPEGEEGFWSAPKACFNCTLNGGTTELPEFWKY